MKHKDNMKVKRVRKKILEISQAHSLLRDKLAALSLRSNTDDEIQRIVRQSFAGSNQCQYSYCSNNESQKPQEDRNEVLDSEFSKSLELPTFPKFKNSETQASLTASKVVSIKTRQAAIKQQGEETSILNRIETVTTCPIIIHRRNNQANAKDIADSTGHRVKSRKTRPVSMGECKGKRMTLPIKENESVGKPESTTETPEVISLAKKKPEYRVLLTSAPSKLCQPEHCITTSPLAKVPVNKNIPERLSVPKHISLKVSNDRGKQSIVTRQKTGKTSQNRATLSSHTTVQMSPEKSSPSRSHERLASHIRSYPVLALSLQHYRGPIGNADLILTFLHQECKTCIPKQQNLTLSEASRNHTAKSGKEDKKIKCPGTCLKGEENIPLTESIVGMQHLLRDKKTCMKETNIIKCSAQLFYGPIDNADFIVTIMYPYYKCQSTPPKTLDYSDGIINLKDRVKVSTESCKPCNVFVHLQCKEKAGETSFPTKKKTYENHISQHCLIREDHDKSIFVSSLDKSATLGLKETLTFGDSADVPDDSKQIKQADALLNKNSKPDFVSEEIPFKEIICTQVSDQNDARLGLHSVITKGSRVPVEGENAENFLMDESAVTASFEILNTSNSFYLENNKMYSKEATNPIVDSLENLPKSEVYRNTVQCEETKRLSPESSHPFTFSLSQFQDSSDYFTMHADQNVFDNVQTYMLERKNENLFLKFNQKKDCRSSPIHEFVVLDIPYGEQGGQSFESRLTCSESSMSSSPISQPLSPSSKLLFCETVVGSCTNCTEARYSPTSTYVGTALGETTLGSELKPIDIPPEVFKSRSRKLLRLNR